MNQLEEAEAERSRVELALRQSETDLAEAQRVSKIGNWAFDAKTGEVRWSRELFRSFGAEGQERVGDYASFLDRVVEEDRPKVRQVNADTQRTGLPFELEYRIVTPDGAQKHIREVGYPKKDADGGVVGLFGTAQDVTELKRTESALRESEAKFRALFETTGVGIALGDPQTGRMGLVNPAFAAMLGYSVSELCGMPLSGFSHPDDLAVEQPMLRELVAGQRSVYDMEKRYLRKDGSFFWGRLNVSVVRDEKGAIIFGIGMLQDVNERRQAEALLARRSRQLAELAAELTLAEQRVRRQLADDLHDHLQQLLVGARMVTHAVSSLPPGQASAGHIDRLSHMLDEALETTRRMTLDLAPPIAMHRNLPDALRWLECAMKRLHGLEVRSQVDGALESVSEAEGVLLYTAARELLLNVVKHSGTRQAELRLGRKDCALELDIRDAGCGFDPARLVDEERRSFGIFSIRERVELFGGAFLLETGPGRGVRALLTLPNRAPASPASRSAVPKPAAPEPQAKASRKAARDARKRVRVLFADDHRIVRESLVSLLQAQPGIEVVGEAGDGREAVESAGRLQPDIVVMDISMPVMDGVEATRLIKGHWPAIKVIGLSMHDAVQGGDKILQAGADGYVCKSGPPELLVDAIRKCVLT
jgi:PAS domain S-box-containing protein